MPLTGVAPNQQASSAAGASPYADKTAQQILDLMYSKGFTQDGVNKVYELRGLANPPTLPASLVGGHVGQGRASAFTYGANGKKLSDVDSRNFLNTFAAQAVDPYHQASGISNIAGGVLSAVGTAVGGPVWGAITGVANAANRSLHPDEANSASGTGKYGALGAAAGAIYGAAGGPGSYGSTPSTGTGGGSSSSTGGTQGSPPAASTGDTGILGRIFGSGNTAAGGSGMGDYTDWIKTALDAYGAYQSGQGNSNARADLNNARLNTTLGGAGVNAPGGMGASLLPDGKGGSYGLGDLEGLRGFLSQLGTNSAQSALTGGLPDSIKQALAGVQGASGTPDAPDTSFLSGGANQFLQRALGDVNRGSAAPGLAATAFQGAGTQLANAGQDFNSVRDQTLQQLRDQASPFETRAFDDLNNSLFSTGRLGSSGGALQTEAFARGLSQADQSRVLSANNEARTQQQQALGIGQGLAGVGSSITGLDSNLLQQAFGNFNSTAGVASDLSQQRFGNSTLLNTMGFDRANSNLNNQITAAQLPTALQGQNLGLALQSLNGTGSLQDQGLAQFQAALAAAQSGANARIGAGSVNAQLAGQRAQIPSSSDMWGQILTGIGSRIGNSDSGNGSFSSILSGLFGGNKTQQPISNTGPTGYQV